jgi:predicted TIM-barrel fold metal-dependent hydrolase
MIIDCHVHVGWKGYDAPAVVHHMDGLGVDKAWTLTWEAIDGGLDLGGYTHLSAEAVLAAHEAHPDRFVPFCAVDPRRENAEDKLRSYVKRGAKGYGEHKLRILADNPDAICMYKLCAELHLPVLIHLDVPLPGCPFWYGGDIDALERALIACPRTTFIGHGPGFWREISAGAHRSTMAYPKGTVRPGGRLPGLLAKYDNLFADISAQSGLNALQRDEEHAKDFLTTFRSKILYGTDAYDRRHLDLLEKLELDRKTFEAITWRNAARLVPI